MSDKKLKDLWWQCRTVKRQVVVIAGTGSGSIGDNMNSPTFDDHKIVPALVTKVEDNSALAVRRDLRRNAVVRQ